MFRLLKYIEPYKTSVVIVLILMFLQSISQLYLPTLMAEIVDRGIVNGDIEFMIKTGVWMLLIAAVGAGCTIWASFLSAKISAGYGKMLRSKLFSKVEGFSLHEFNSIGTSSLITRTTNDITQVQQVLLMILRVMISAPMMGIGGIIMALSKDTKLSMILMVVMPLLTLSIVGIARKGMPLFKSMQLKIDKLNLVLREELTGIRVIRAFNRTNYEIKRFNKANGDLTETAIKANKIMAALMPIIMLFMNFTTIAIVWFGGIRISNGHMLVGDMMAFIQYVMQIMFSMIMVSMLFVMLPRAQVSASRINEVLDIDCEIKDPEILKTWKEVKGTVDFNNVSFRYPGAEEAAIQNISFSLKPGQITAIIGGTGSGKTTILNLIQRFYDVNHGSITIDGIDIRDISQERLRANIGYVPQKSMLFSGTIKENIKYGKEDATDDEVTHAAQIAQATEFILEMKDGFDAHIAQAGTNISGGQKQRLSIARALIRKAQILIFDDSFSALDFKTDAQLRSALQKEITNATVLIVTQRVSTIMDANQIIVMDKGELVGVGSHRELMVTCDVYREIIASQIHKEEIA